MRWSLLLGGTFASIGVAVRMACDAVARFDDALLALDDDRG